MTATDEDEDEGEIIRNNIEENEMEMLQRQEKRRSQILSLTSVRGFIDTDNGREEKKSETFHSSDQVRPPSVTENFSVSHTVPLKSSSDQVEANSLLKQKEREREEKERTNRKREREKKDREKEEKDREEEEKEKEDMYSLFTLAQRERIFHGVKDPVVSVSHFTTNPLTYEIHMEIKQQLDIQLNKIKQMYENEIGGVVKQLDELKLLLLDLKKE
eukprot:CAMPEP_0182419812 /NCGR_PEP_ID=MMETSP1167-20130531/4172_1 /TAXON_ID=2988 /ORGANISM="Mallomonas Sp, Strain CCMP3275" /LENGTH=215 /DNA_ID=CAMNT_0024594913 /DNA_START=146 /DNA_END=793 /DNA_ORIENTATION=-